MNFPKALNLGPNIVFIAFSDASSLTIRISAALWAYLYDTSLEEYGGTHKRYPPIRICVIMTRKSDLAEGKACLDLQVHLCNGQSDGDPHPLCLTLA